MDRKTRKRISMLLTAIAAFLCCGLIIGPIAAPAFADLAETFRNAGPAIVLSAAAVGMAVVGATDQNKPAETLSRGQMEDVIRGGGSVGYGGRIISRVEDLPTAVQLAQSDEQREKARKELTDRRSAIDQQLAELEQASAREASADEVKRQQASATGAATPSPADETAVHKSHTGHARK